MSMVNQMSGMVHSTPSMEMHNNPTINNHENVTLTNHGQHGNNNGMDTGVKHNPANTGHATHNTYFNINYPVQILFVEWLVATPGQLAGACVGVFVISIIYEGLKVLRTSLLVYSGQKRHRADHCSNVPKNGNEVVIDTLHSTSTLSRMCNGWHILQSVLQVVQTTLGMFLMLIYMTFNVWLALCVSLGSGFGYYFFGWMQRHNIEWSDHCN